MAYLNGNLFLLQVNTGVSYRYIAGITSNSLEVTADMIDITTKDSSGWATFIPGRIAATLNVNFLYDPEVTATYADIVDLHTAWAAGTLLYFQTGQMTVGAQFFSMGGYISSISVDSSQNDVTTVSVSFQVSGAITQSAYNP